MDFKERISRIKEKVDMTQVLSDYGYDVRVGDFEQQFSCDLHGDGSDSAPSARVYTDGSWYCFGCSKQRDAIETVREVEGLEFHEACALLEKRYNLPFVKWTGKRQDPEEPLQLERPTRGYSDEKKRLKALLDSIQEDREVDLRKRIKWWEAYDTVVWKSERGDMSEDVGAQILVKIHERIMGELKV